MTEEYTYNCYICGASGCTKEDYNGDGIFVCKDCNSFASAANLLLNVPVTEIEYLVKFVEDTLDNVLHEVGDFGSRDIDTVREWLKLVKKDREA